MHLLISFLCACIWNINKIKIHVPNQRQMFGKIILYENVDKDIYLFTVYIWNNVELQNVNMIECRITECTFRRYKAKLGEHSVRTILCLSFTNKTMLLVLQC